MKKLLALLVLSFPLVLKAQNSTSASYWGITLHVGPFASGLPSHLEEKMKSQGYQPHSGGLFGGGPAMDMTKQKAVYQLGLEKITSKSWSGKLLLSTLAGNLSGISSQQGDLDLDYKITTSSLLGGYYFKQKVIRVAVGPALHFISLKGNDRPYDSNASVKKKYTKIGFAVEGGLRFPAATKFFFDFNTQYQKVGEQDMGIYTFEEVDPNGQLYTTTFNAGTKALNYLTFNFGLGVRLGNLRK